MPDKIPDRIGMPDRSHDLDYKRGSIDQRPSFYNNHVSAIVRKLYSKKA
jgi:hypothetical protein